MKKLAKYLTVPMLFACLAGPVKSAENPVKLGVVSDIEGDVSNARASANKLESKSIDAVVIAGDCYENEGIRRNPMFPDSTNNVEEMVRGIKPYAELGVPVYCIPGNHEEKSVYERAVDKLDNVYDINGKTVNIGDAKVVGMGGYHDSRFTAEYLLKKEDYVEAYQSLEEGSVFVTHGPPRADCRIDYVPGVGHVGDRNLSKILRTGDYTHISGHIHEGGQRKCQIGDSTAINISSVTGYKNEGADTGILKIGEETKYKTIE